MTISCGSFYKMLNQKDWYIIKICENFTFNNFGNSFKTKFQGDTGRRFSFSFQSSTTAQRPNPGEGCRTPDRQERRKIEKAMQRKVKGDWMFAVSKRKRMSRQKIMILTSSTSKETNISSLNLKTLLEYLL